MRVICLIAVCCSSVLVPAQTVTIGTGAAVNTTTSYPAPYGNWYWGSRHQILVPASELIAAGMPPGPVTALAFDVVTPGGALWDFEVKIGHSTTTSLVAWETGLQSVHLSPFWTSTTGWNTHPFPTPFVWNGTDNIVVETCHQNPAFSVNAIFNQTTVGYNATLLYRADATGVCGNAGVAPTASWSPLARPNMRFTLGAPQFQVNQPNASMDVNGAVAGGASAGSLRICTSSAATLNLQTALAVTGFDIWTQPNPAVPANAGGVTTGSGQLLNVDLTDPLGSWVFGGVAPLASNPLAAPGQSLGFFTAPVSLTLAGQMGVVDPGSADGFSLSQAVELEIVSSYALPIGGPGGDDASTTFNFLTEFCSPGYFYYGTVYTEFHVSSNGRVVFGAADSDFSPSVGEALTDNPFAGFWTDLNPHPVSGGGNITVDSSAPGVVRVNYNGVIYYGQSAAPNTFAVVMDTNNGDLTLDGLTGIGNNPAVVGSAAGDAQFFGISGGLAVGATDPGTTLFTSGGTGAPALPTDMLYDLHPAGAAGVCPSLAPGTLSSVIFSPAGGGYLWLGL